MAINFQLIDKLDKKPVSLTKIDEEICEKVLAEKPHKKYYGGSGKNSFNWFDTIGFQLASGKTLEEGQNSVRKYYQTSDDWLEELPIIEKIITFLQNKYTCRSWVSR